MLSYEDFLNQAKEFLIKVLSAAQENAISLEDHWHIDHLCFRVSDESSYTSWRIWH